MCRPTRPPDCITTSPGTRQRRLAQASTRPRPRHSPARSARVGGDAGGDELVLDVVALEQLAGERATRSSTAACARRGSPSCRRRGARPSPRVAQVVGGLLLRLAGQRGERRVGRPRHRLPVGERERVVQELAHDHVGEVAVRLLDEQRVEELALIAPVGEVVLVVTRRPRPRRRSVYSARAWPIRSSARLASAMSSSISGAWVICSSSRWASTSARSPWRST